MVIFNKSKKFSEKWNFRNKKDKKEKIMERWKESNKKKDGTQDLMSPFFFLLGLGGTFSQ